MMAQRNITDRAHRYRAQAELFPLSFLGFVPHCFAQSDAALDRRPFAMKFYDSFKLSHAGIIFKSFAQQFQMVLGLTQDRLHQSRALAIAQEHSFWQSLEYRVRQHHLAAPQLLIPSGAPSAGNHPSEPFNDPQTRHFLHQVFFALVNPFRDIASFYLLISEGRQLDSFIQHQFNPRFQFWLQYRRHKLSLSPVWIPIWMAIRKIASRSCGWVSRIRVNTLPGLNGTMSLHRLAASFGLSAWVRNAETLRTLQSYTLGVA